MSPASCSPPTPCTVKKTFEAAQATGNALLVQVKDNQGRLLARLQQLSRTQPATDVDETVTRNRRGRRNTERWKPSTSLDSSIAPGTG